MNLRAWYGYARLTKKSVLKRQFLVVFENEYNPRNDEKIAQKMTVVYTRFQTKEEIGTTFHHRMFQSFGYFIDEKPFNGNIERCLEQNFVADKNNVSLKVRTTIRELMREAYYSSYKINRKLTGQQALIFE